MLYNSMTTNKCDANFINYTQHVYNHMFYCRVMYVMYLP